MQNGTFPGAVYDLGIIYKMLGNNDSAADSFAQLDMDRDASTIEKINSLEQLGFIKFELAENRELVEEDKNALIQDAHAVLWRALELQASVLRDLPQLHFAWNAFSTMEMTLKKDSRDDNDFAKRDLAKLYKLMGHYNDAIQLYKHLHHSRGEDHGSTLRIDMIETYLQRGTQSDFNEAVLLSKLVSSAENTKKDISLKLLVTVHVKAAVNSVQHGLFKLAVERFNAAYNALRALTTTEGNYDLVILHNCPKEHNCELALRVKDLFQFCCNLKVTINDEECLAGVNPLHYYKSIFEHCSTILVVFHNDLKTEDTEGMHPAVKWAVEMSEFRPKFLLLSDKELAKDLHFGALPSISLPSITSSVERQHCLSDDSTCQWVEQFLLWLLELSELESVTEGIAKLS